MAVTEDSTFQLAEDAFDESVPRRRCNEIISELMARGGDDRALAFALEAEITSLVHETQQWVLDRLVIGIWNQDIPCMTHWTATRPTNFDAIEHDREQWREIAELKRSHGMVDEHESGVA
jgi:hypothetical protein